MQTNKEALLSAYKKVQPEFIPAEKSCSVEIVMPGDRYFGPEAEGYDMFGVRWTQLGPNPALDGNTPTPGYRRLEDITKWKEAVQFPNLDALPLELIFGGMMQNVDREKTVVKGLLLSGTFERMNQLMGMEDAMCALLLEPEATHELLNAIADYKIKCIDKMIEFVDPDIIHMHDDWGMSTSMLFSTEVWREFFKPIEKRYSDHIHAKGKIYEHHSCGNITAIIGDLVEIGLDALNPLNVCNDLESIKKTYGDRLTMVGGLNNQVIDRESVDEETIRQEVRRAMDAYAGGGNYIPSAIYTKQRTVDIASDEIARYGKYIYQEA